ncbi:hypothetical protein RRG08_004730, partial [Elysia crispata]
SGAHTIGDTNWFSINLERTCNWFSINPEGTSNWFSINLERTSQVTQTGSQSIWSAHLRLMENQFISPEMCAPDLWITSSMCPPE